MNPTRTSLSVLAAALVLLCGCGTTSTTSSPPTPDPSVRVGIAPNLAPLAFRFGSEYRGVEADLAQALAAMVRKWLRSR